MNENFYAAVVEKPTKSYSETIFDDTESIVWIDWREEEDSIVHAIAAKIPEFLLSAVVRAANNDAGYDIQITCRDQERVIDPDAPFDSRHATLNAIDELVSPEYQVRFVTETNGADTMGVVVELRADWERLYQRFGRRLNEHFCPIRELPDLMNTPGSKVYRAVIDYAAQIG